MCLGKIFNPTTHVASGYVRVYECVCVGNITTQFVNFRRHHFRDACVVVGQN